MARLLALLALSLALAVAATEKANPISRVADLLQGLSKKVEADGKAEEEMFETYVCWYKTVTSEKKATNAAAQDRITSLESYIKDIESGKIEFTNERETLEKEIAELETEIKQATEVRNTEERDFLAAKAEMEAGIEALKQAVEVLEKGTEGSLVAFRGELDHAVEVGQSFLSKADVQRLNAALDAPDWVKLNKDNKHNNKYKKSSTKIQDILKDMLDTFQDNLADAVKMEAEKKKTFETLMASKEAQLSSSQDALASGEEEGGARTLNKDEANAEKEALETQVENDNGFIKQVEEAYAAQTEAWKERCRLRTEEIASIQEAIAVLTSDEARDVAKSSFQSQGISLLQEVVAAKAAQGDRKRRGAKAQQVLKRVAISSKDLRLSLLALDVASASKTGGHFDNVVESVEKMITDLHKESDADLEKKETCEKERDENTAVARRQTYAIDDQTSLIVRKEHQVDELNAKIDAATNAIKEAELKLEEATVQRQKEHVEYKAAKADDEAAKGLVKKASEVLSKFYQDNNIALVQRQRQAPYTVGAISAGEAPPPPPPMFSEPYGGAKGESNGIQAILSMIEEDIEKDIKEATAEEEEAKADLASFKTDTEETVASLKTEITGYEEEIAECNDVIKDARTTRGDKKEVLDGALEYLRSIAKGCDFMAANFEYRQQNRYTEIDGLLEAEAALQGGSVAAAKAQMAADTR